MIAAQNVVAHEILMQPRRVWGKRPLVTFSVVSGNKSEEPNYPPMSRQDYLALVKSLIANGRAEKKIGKVIAFELTDLAMQTEQDNHAAETTHGLLVPTNVILFDPNYFTTQDAKTTVARIFKVYGRHMTSDAVCKALNGGQLVSSIVSATGIWTVDRKKFHAKQSRGPEFKGDYIPSPEAFVYRTVEGTGRIVASHQGNTASMFCNWTGGFNLRTGAGIATLFPEVPKLVAAVKQVEAEGSTDAAIEKHLMAKGEKSDQMIAKFDVYGMFPGFREDNYRPISAVDSLNDEGIAAVAALREAGNNRALGPVPNNSVLKRLVPGT